MIDGELSSRGDKRPTTVAIVEDQKEVREGLVYLLGLDGRVSVSSNFGRAEDLLEWLKDADEPDIVLSQNPTPGAILVLVSASPLSFHTLLVSIQQ